MIQDKWGNLWETERFNGHVVDGLAKSLVMFLAGESREAIAEQQRKEQPIGGWQAAHTRLAGAAVGT